MTSARWTERQGTEQPSKPGAHARRVMRTVTPAASKNSSEVTGSQLRLRRVSPGRSQYMLASGLATFDAEAADTWVRSLPS